MPFPIKKIHYCAILNLMFNYPNYCDTIHKYYCHTNFVYVGKLSYQILLAVNILCWLDAQLHNLWWLNHKLQHHFSSEIPYEILMFLSLYKLFMQRSRSMRLWSWCININNFRDGLQRQLQCTFKTHCSNITYFIVD